MSFLVRNPADGQLEHVDVIDGYEGWELVSDAPDCRPIEDGVWANGRWLIPVPTLKLFKWRQMKTARALEEEAGCVTPHGTIDSDPASRARVMELVELARADGDAFSIVFTMKDNSAVALTAGQMIEVGRALVLQQVRIHDQSRAAREQIELAVTRAQVMAVEWPTAIE